MGPTASERLAEIHYQPPEWQWFEESDVERADRMRLVMAALDRAYAINENDKQYRYTFEVMDGEPDHSLKVWAKTYLRGNHIVAHGHIWCQSDTDAVMIRLAHGETMRRRMAED